MVGMTLVDIRDHIETLASEDGAYYITCSRTGDRPVPVTGHRFADRKTARRALRATVQYRSALRQYDPQVPYYDLIVCQAPTAPAVEHSQCDPAAEEYALTDPVVGRAGAEAGRALVEFCHRSAGALFETLSARGHDAVETAVMDAYFAHAESVSDPDELCLCLLEQLAATMDAELSPADQAAVVHAAAKRLPRPDTSAAPIQAAFDRLQAHGIVGDVTHARHDIDRTTGTKSVVLTVSEYALSRYAERLPLLPAVLELARQLSVWHPIRLPVVDTGDAWRLTVVLSRTEPPRDIVSGPIYERA
jgi:hypothetical protein